MKSKRSEHKEKHKYGGADSAGGIDQTALRTQQAAFIHTHFGHRFKGWNDFDAAKRFKANMIQMGLWESWRDEANRSVKWTDTTIDNAVALTLLYEATSTLKNIRAFTVSSQRF